MKLLFIVIIIAFISDFSYSQSNVGVNYSIGTTSKTSDNNARLTDSRILRFPKIGTASYTTSSLSSLEISYRYRFKRWHAQGSLQYIDNNVRLKFSNFDRSLLLRINTIHPSVAIIRDLLGNKKIVLSAKLGLNTGFTIAKRTSIFETDQFELVTSDTVITKGILNLNSNEPSIRFAGVFSLQAVIPIAQRLSFEIGAGVYSEFNKPNKVYHYEYFYNSNSGSEWELALESDRFNERYLFFQFGILKKIGAK